MCIEIVDLCKSLIAVLTGKWSFLGVGAEVDLQVVFMISFVITLRTLVWLDTFMDFF